MRRSVLEAIREGEWDFELSPLQEELFDSTTAMPGSDEKVKELARRASQGLPLWHSKDRRSFGDSDGNR